MIILKNANYPTFLYETLGKRIILFGTGGTFRDFLANNSEKIDLLESIDFILDNDEKKSGCKIYLPVKTLEIEGVKTFSSTHSSINNYIVLLLTADRSLMQVVEQLDKIPLFDHIPCYYGISSLTWGREYYPPLPVNPVLPVSNMRYLIPRIIHFIWFGNQPMNDLAKHCIASWKKRCPDYEIKIWTEENYDLSSAPIYVKQAYEAKKYAFVSDYVRLDIVYRYGGFYFDTDVESVRNIDNLLHYKAVFAYTSFNRIGTGIGFGSVAGYCLLKKQLEVYRHVVFQYGDGTLNLTDYINSFSDILLRKNFIINNTLFYYNDVLVLPSSFFSPFALINAGKGYEMPFLFQLSESTYAVHFNDCTWFDPEISSIFRDCKQEFLKINNRLLNDWRRTCITEVET